MKLLIINSIQTIYFQKILGREGNTKIFSKKAAKKVNTYVCKVINQLKNTFDFSPWRRKKKNYNSLPLLLVGTATRNQQRRIIELLAVEVSLFTHKTLKITINNQSKQS